MKNIAIILNALLMAVLGLASAIVIDPLDNRAIEYPSAPFIDHPLPPLSALLLGNMWITWAVPVIWALISLWMVIRKKNSADYAALHTSATLLLGILLLLLFTFAGVFPFVGYIAHLKP